MTIETYLLATLLVILPALVGFGIFKLIEKVIDGGIHIHIGYDPVRPITAEEPVEISKEEQEYIDRYNQEQAEMIASLQSIQQLFGMNAVKEDTE